MIKRYKRKSYEIEAIQYTGENIVEIAEFVKPQICFGRLEDGTFFLKEGISSYTVEVGDWIVKKLEERCYPHSEDAFKRNYEKVE